MRHRVLLSFPTRRSSELALELLRADDDQRTRRHTLQHHDRSTVDERLDDHRLEIPGRRDRKSTRLNSSHLGISYAVFCLKKETPAYHLLEAFPCIQEPHS